MLCYPYLQVQRYQDALTLCLVCTLAPFSQRPSQRHRSSGVPEESAPRPSSLESDARTLFHLRRGCTLTHTTHTHRHGRTTHGANARARERQALETGKGRTRRARREQAPYRLLIASVYHSNVARATQRNSRAKRRMTGPQGHRIKERDSLRGSEDKGERERERKIAQWRRK